MTDEALKAVERANELLDDDSRPKESFAMTTAFVVPGVVPGLP